MASLSGKNEVVLISEMLFLTEEYGPKSETEQPGFIYSKFLYLEDDLFPFLTVEEIEGYHKYGVGVLITSPSPTADGLPSLIYACSADGKNIGVIRRGMRFVEDFSPAAIDVELDEQIAMFNNIASVTPEQELAMIYGMKKGWDKDGSDPDFYSTVNPVTLVFGKDDDNKNQLSIQHPKDLEDKL